eukprot:scaffold3097_cov70-Phaeocystis_antarctica.AAC.3
MKAPLATFGTPPPTRRSPLQLRPQCTVLEPRHVPRPRFRDRSVDIAHVVHESCVCLRALRANRHRTLFRVFLLYRELLSACWARATPRASASAAASAAQRLRASFTAFGR